MNRIPYSSTRSAYSTCTEFISASERWLMDEDEAGHQHGGDHHGDPLLEQHPVGHGHTL